MSRQVIAGPNLYSATYKTNGDKEAATRLFVAKDKKEVMTELATYDVDEVKIKLVESDVSLVILAE